MTTYEKPYVQNNMCSKYYMLKITYALNNISSKQHMLKVLYG